MFLVDPCGKLNESLKFFYEKMKDHETLFIIDDCAASKDIVKKRNTLAELAFSGRYAKISMWVFDAEVQRSTKGF